MTTLRRKLIGTSLLGAVALGFGNSASALPLAQYDATVLNVFISGASEQAQTLELYLRAQFSPGTLDVYRAKNQAVYFGTIASGKVAGFPAAGRKVAVHKSDEGGAGNGVGPVARLTALNFLDLTQLKALGPNGGGDAPVTVPAVPGTSFIAYTNHTNVATRFKARVPDAGLAVLPSLFTKSFTPALTAAELARLNVTSQYQVIYTVPVTKALRNALQTAQGKTVGSETAANQPTLSFAQLKGIYAGTQTTFGGKALKVARRNSTSAVQAFFEVIFGLGNRVGTGQPAFVGTQFSSGGDLRTFLTSESAAGRYVVGLQGSESVPGAADGWRNIKVNGLSPTLLSVATTGNRGNAAGYTLFGDNALVWRKSTAPSPLPGLPLALLNDAKTELGLPNTLRQANIAARAPYGDGGTLALKSNGFTPPSPLTQTTLRTNPTSPFIRPNPAVAPQ